MATVRIEITCDSPELLWDACESFMPVGDQSVFVSTPAQGKMRVWAYHHDDAVRSGEADAAEALKRLDRWQESRRAAARAQEAPT